MTRDNRNERLTIVIGAIGICGLLIASLGYALLESGTFYEPEKINQFVLDQQATAPEDPSDSPDSQ